MDNNFQKTLGGPVTLSGVGLHTGIKSAVTLKPAKENAGLFFTRTDLDSNPIIYACVDNVIETNRGTVLQENGVKIHTVEHVLSAIYGIGIDNVNIEISGPEPPIIDGSSQPFVNAIRDVGVISQKAQKNIFKIKEKICYRNNDIEINILPNNNFKITFFMDYGLPDFGIQYSAVENVEKEFESQIAPARTFGLLSEIEYLKGSGLIKGGSLDNAVVFVDKEIDANEGKTLLKLFEKNAALKFKKGSILNIEGLRFDNEPVRHKVLDLIGDLSLFGRPIQGHIIATKSGHNANIEFIRKLKILE